MGLWVDGSAIHRTIVHRGVLARWYSEGLWGLFILR
jgi:hypothetical protein